MHAVVPGEARKDRKGKAAGAGEGGFLGVTERVSAFLVQITGKAVSR